MSEIHTKKYLEENPEVATESTSTPTPSVTTGSPHFFSGIFFKLVVLLIILGGACGYVFFQSQKVFIDNPSKEKITVKINEKEYTIEANSSITANIGFGKHKVEVIGKKTLGGEFERNFNMNAESIMKFKDYAFGEYDLVNPLLYPYILDYAIYGGSGKNGIPPKVHTELYIPNNWDYGLNEKFPESVSISRRGGSSGSVTKKKIFRFLDFSKEYNIPEKQLLEELVGQ